MQAARGASTRSTGDMQQSLLALTDEWRVAGPWVVYRAFDESANFLSHGTAGRFP